MSRTKRISTLRGKGYEIVSVLTGQSKNHTFNGASVIMEHVKTKKQILVLGRDHDSR